MPRQSLAAQAAPAVKPNPTRLAPPGGLSPSVRRIFESLVAAAPADHFRPSDQPLLVEYARAIALADRAAQMLEAEGEVTERGRPSGWLVVQEKAQRAMIALSLRLRLAPQGRMSAAKAGGLKGSAPAGVDFKSYFQAKEASE